MKHRFDNDEIERRMRAMRPAEPGASLRQRIGESLATQPADASRPAPRRVARIALAVAAVLAVAGLAGLWVTGSPQSRDEQVPSGQSNVVDQSPAPRSNDPADPLLAEQPGQPMTGPSTLLALRLAWHDSPQAFDDLLNRAQPFNNPEASSGPTPIFTVADARRWVHNEELP